ncbi:hypothetical protein EBGED10_51090 [Bacillus sp. GeD10]|nr:hypothetical protein EBGED10_51090 [Bacillus sp. GeD10]
MVDIVDVAADIVAGIAADIADDIADDIAAVVVADASLVALPFVGKVEPFA